MTTLRVLHTEIRPSNSNTLASAALSEEDILQMGCEQNVSRFSVVSIPFLSLVGWVTNQILIRSVNRSVLHLRHARQSIASARASQCLKYYLCLNIAIDSDLVYCNLFLDLPPPFPPNMCTEI